MTDAKDMVEVTQADREAAADYTIAWAEKFGSDLSECSPVEEASDAILKGDLDNEILVQAFARHRLTAQAPRMACPDLINEDHGEAVDWITANCTAVRRDNGDLDYSLGAMIAAYEAGKTSAQAQGGDVEKVISKCERYGAGRKYIRISELRIHLASTHPTPTELPVDALRDAELVEVIAKAIYGEWEHREGFVPWVESGNSLMQEEARRKAYRYLPALTTKEDASHD